MYIPVGAKPNTMAELVADLERRQSRNPAGGDVSSKASTQSANSANTGTTAPTTPAGGSAATKQTAAEAIPIGRQPRSLAHLVEDLERRQANSPAVDDDASSVASGQSAPSVASADSGATSNAGTGSRPASTRSAAQAPKAISGRSEDLVDFLVGLDRRQTRGSRTGSSAESAESSQSAPSVSSVGSSNAGRGQQPAPTTTPAPTSSLPPPAAAPTTVAPPASTLPVAAQSLGGRSNDLVDFLVDLSRRQAKPAVGSQASSAPSEQSANSQGTNNSAATSNRNQRAPAAPAPTAPAGIVAKSIAIGEQPSSIAELMADLDRRQANRAPNGSDDATSVASGQSANSAGTSDAGTGSRPAASGKAAPLAVARPVALEAKSIPIGGQPSSLAELLADLEKRQEKKDGKASSVSSGSSQSAKSVDSKDKGTTSSAPAQATQAPTTISAQPTPPAAVLPGEAQSTPSPSSAAPPQTTPAIPEGGNDAVQSPAAPTSTSAGAADKVNGANPSPTTLLTLTSEPPRTTVLPTAPQNNVAQPAGSATAGIDPQPQNVGVVAGAIVGSLLGVAILGAIIFFLCRRQQRKRDSGSVTERRRNWESRLYGSERSTVSGGARSTIRSFFARRSAGPGPAQPGNISEAPSRFPSHHPTLPKAAFDSRRSERSTGLSALDEKQYQTYQNLVGRLNEKQPVPFDHPYYQNDEWK
ncbi:hypothetical protein PgNI_05344 [Pyricularia grisea]|uniref:Mid2 domain-containing protein n=1 Tax=Pyricularia grisea TaxID=148305 RepID=A0A6P8B899_PYRGI|nr:hypothetical protein PgNI_05344 [Pyricularia grisea]TLD11329.1 hypothetical protein PgNI_05344 [Pyricularia grisea]